MQLNVKKIIYVRHALLGSFPHRASRTSRRATGGSAAATGAHCISNRPIFVDQFDPARFNVAVLSVAFDQCPSLVFNVMRHRGASDPSADHRLLVFAGYAG